MGGGLGIIPPPLCNGLPMPKVANPYFAAVDLGSNSFHLLIMRLQQGF